MLDPTALAESFRGCLRAAMRIPTIEAAFPAPWPAAARRVLPSPSPQFTATAMWGPVLGWCALELLAESIDPENKPACALDLFDRLRLREPFAHAFAALGFEGEESWRVSARIKVLLMSASGVREAQPLGSSEEPPAALKFQSEDEEDVPADELPEAAVGEPEVPAKEPRPATQPAKSPGSEHRESGEGNSPIAPALWTDPDVRWLAGVHEAETHSYLVREPYEELLWWLLLPRLLGMAGAPTLDRAEVKAINASLQSALAAAEAAGYRIEVLTGHANQEKAPEPAAPSPVPDTEEPETETEVHEV
jgi:hypothetical protein